jgi:hypothetical protein
MDNKGYIYTFRICNATCFSNCAGDKIEKNELGVHLARKGGGESRVRGCGGETWGKETTGETQA